jgi:hypothetical protein
MVQAARALAAGEPLVALGAVGRVESALGLTLRGIAYAQLGDLDLARTSLERGLAQAEDASTVARIRAALVEVALGTGDPALAARGARTGADELDRLGDDRNAAMQRLVLARAEILLGHLDEARRAIDGVLRGALPPDVRAVAWLARAELGVRTVAASDARAALSRARRALARAPHPLLEREIAACDDELTRPVARLQRSGALREADLFEVERASGGALLLVDACRRLAVSAGITVSLARRPVPFALLLVLARAFPASVPRDELALRAFDVRRVNASHRARLRVEMGRLRKLLHGLGAAPVATADGYALTSARDVAVLLALSDDDAARVALLLGDGATWSAQRVAEHAGISKRTAQRALGALVARGVAVRFGRGRTVRYARAGAPIASRMLLLGLVPTT